MVARRYADPVHSPRRAAGCTDLRALDGCRGCHFTDHTSRERTVERPLVARRRVDRVHQPGLGPCGLCRRSASEPARRRGLDGRAKGRGTEDLQTGSRGLHRHRMDPHLRRARRGRYGTPTHIRRMEPQSRTTWARASSRATTTSPRAARSRSSTRTGTSTLIRTPGSPPSDRARGTPRT